MKRSRRFAPEAHESPRGRLFLNSRAFLCTFSPSVKKREWRISLFISPDEGKRAAGRVMPLWSAMTNAEWAQYACRYGWWFLAWKGLWARGAVFINWLWCTRAHVYRSRFRGWSDPKSCWRHTALNYKQTATNGNLLPQAMYKSFIAKIRFFKQNSSQTCNMWFYVIT